MGNDDMDEWERKMERARRLHRPSLKNWARDKMYKSFPTVVEDLQKQDNYQSFFTEPDGPYAKNQQQQPIPAVLDAVTLTREEFYKYEVDRIPCVLQNIVAGHDAAEFTKPWDAQEKWTFEALSRDDTLLQRRFKCGEDDDERNIKVRLEHFLQYTEKNRDDSPLYVFDSAFDDDEMANRILTDYRVPSYFSDDLFGLVSESRRPPYRWWLIGPVRSGTCVHIDPLATSAWNTLVVGQKRWVLFPPHVPKSVVKGSGLVRDDEDDEAIHYFHTILPRIKRKAHTLRGTPKYRNFCCYEFTQNPGETCFIPQGWWHAVLNISDTVAITQNFCSPRNFDSVWLKTRGGRKKMAWKLLCQLEVKYPELAERAKAANKRDRYVMKYDPVEVERRERAERKRKEERREERKRRKQEEQHKSKLNEKLKCELDGSDPRPRGTTSLDQSFSRLNCDNDSKRQRRDSHHVTASPSA
jgi:histone arginine demethylase JMJD6